MPVISSYLSQNASTAVVRPIVRSIVTLLLDEASYLLAKKERALPQTFGVLREQPKRSDVEDYHG